MRRPVRLTGRAAPWPPGRRRRGETQRNPHKKTARKKTGSDTHTGKQRRVLEHPPHRLDQSRASSWSPAGDRRLAATHDGARRVRRAPFSCRGHRNRSPWLALERLLARLPRMRTSCQVIVFSRLRLVSSDIFLPPSDSAGCWLPVLLFWWPY